MKGTALPILLFTPHRDCLPALAAYRMALFQAGFAGAFAFPQAIPLAAPSRAFTPGELRSLGRRLRETLGEGFFTAGHETAVLRLPASGPGAPSPALYGPLLRPNPNETVAALITALDPQATVFPEALLCAALLPGTLKGVPPSPPPQGTFMEGLRFRAASLANCLFAPLPHGAGTAGYSFRWRLGKAVWLPAPAAVNPGEKGRGLLPC